jgi:hypothetical protein
LEKLEKGTPAATLFWLLAWYSLISTSKFNTAALDLSVSDLERGQLHANAPESCVAGRDEKASTLCVLATGTASMLFAAKKSAAAALPAAPPVCAAKKAATLCVLETGTC